MRKLQGNQEASLKYMQNSFDEQLQKIHETRRKINAALDTIEQKTLNAMKDTLAKLQASCKDDVEECISLQDKLKQLRDAIQDISDKSKLELSFIATSKCKDKTQHCETFLKKNSLQAKVSVTFQPNSEIVQYLSKLSGLGTIEHSTQTLMEHENPNKVFTVQGKSKHNVRISGDSVVCSICAICVLQEGQVLIADESNKTIKLLDQQYQVVSHCSVTTWPFGMCQITLSEVAVTLESEVQFITINNRKLVTGRKLQLHHACFGIACHQDDLYITDQTALYKYTLSGKQVSKMYEDKSGPCTVRMCAVSPTGDKLYIINNSDNKVLTLARVGSVLATFTDPALIGPCYVHVTPAGQVLVCGGESHTIIQVVDEGRKKLAILATKEDGVVSPESVCYNRHTASILVGLFENNSILVLKVQ
ncbi:hypothetical protein DPMN_183640 [Dreissena polymorpha]|uniref:Uncharacterized protein n=1 Tax=Dreissena polymorpha TaxID=45954 RepID=A0A9D4DKB2_DREPO|nr:hypothetical protein DPMN_183640 [Dreissena polymorpha]